MRRAGGGRCWVGRAAGAWVLSGKLLRRNCPQGRLMLLGWACPCARRDTQTRAAAHAGHGRAGVACPSQSPTSIRCLQSQCVGPAPDYAASLRAAGDVLFNLTEENLKEMGVEKIGDRLLITDIVQTLYEQASDPSPQLHFCARERETRKAVLCGRRARAGSAAALQPRPSNLPHGHVHRGRQLGRFRASRLLSAIACTPRCCLARARDNAQGGTSGSPQHRAVARTPRLEHLRSIPSAPHHACFPPCHR